VAIRKLPSGKWQATVRMPNGKRITKTDVLRSRAAAWEHEQRAAFARGEFRDPRAGRITVGQWFERWIEARAIEEVTRDKLRSSWRAHCELQWGRWPMDAITHMEAQEWIRIMERKRRAKHRGRPGDEDSPVIAAGTIHTAAHLMSSLFKAACNERPPIVLSNPFARLDLPEVTPSTIYFYEPDEVQALLTALRELRPDEPQWPALVELGTWVGLRPGELFGLPGNRVDWLRAQIEVAGWEVNVCQCEEVTRRELVETKPPRYLKWDSPQMSARSVGTLLRDGPVNQDQIKRLTRAGMGPCQSRRCREQVGLLLAQAAGTTLDRIPLPTFRPPIRPLPLNVLWPDDEPAAMREHWVSWFGIPTQFSPHWEPGMVLDEPTAHTRLIVSDE